MKRIFLASLPLLVLAACGSGDPAGQTTTKLDAVEVQPGSVSDAMIVLDDASADGTAVDNSVPDESGKKAAEKSDAEGDEPVANDDDADANPDAVPAPAAKRAVTADSAAKKTD